MDRSSSMALIKCPECGRKVSDRAQTCPSCGAPIADAAGPGLVTLKTIHPWLNKHRIVNSLNNPKLGILVNGYEKAEIGYNAAAQFTIDGPSTIHIVLKGDFLRRKSNPLEIQPDQTNNLVCEIVQQSKFKQAKFILTRTDK